MLTMNGNHIRSRLLLACLVFANVITAVIVGPPDCAAVRRIVGVVPSTKSLATVTVKDEESCLYFCCHLSRPPMSECALPNIHSNCRMPRLGVHAARGRRRTPRPLHHLHVRRRGRVRT